MSKDLGIDNIEKDVAKVYKLITCNICGCKQYITNFARHSKTKNKKHSSQNN